MKWVTPAPVRAVEGVEFERLAKEFIENLEQDWMLKKAKKIQKPQLGIIESNLQSMKLRYIEPKETNMCILWTARQQH